jgi:GH35 family endo-1,4-beta-xylanase
MKIKNIVTVLLVTIILASCAPAVQPTPIPPTETAVPTITPVPPTPTITPTPAPENLADAKDLSKWVDNYVHAFGGKVTVNGVDMDANQLTEEIRKSAETFTQVKEINGVEYLFLLINNIPLAMREGKGQWEELTSRKIIELKAKPEDTLKYIGAQFSNPFEINTTSQVDDVISHEFNGAHLNDGSWHVVEQSEGHPDFTLVVKAAETAREKDMTFIMGGVLLDPRGEFDYTYLKNKTNLTPENLLNIIKEHIRMEMEALKGKIDAITVVNESRPANEVDNEGGLVDPYNTIIGEQYIEEAFQTAREIDPSVVLIYNDGFNYHPSNDYTNGSNNTPRTLEIVSRLKGKGLIDGVGLQMHINASEPPNADKMIKTFKDYGIPVYVTEFEININGISGTEEEKEQVRLKLRKEILEAMLKSGVVVSISHWTALDDDNGNKGQLFDNNLAPTADLFVERQVLFEYFLGK